MNVENREEIYVIMGYGDDNEEHPRISFRSREAAEKAVEENREYSRIIQMPLYSEVDEE